MKVILLDRFRCYVFLALIIALNAFFSPTSFAAYVSMYAIDWETGTSDYGYGNGINTISFRRNAIYTVGNYQFVSYYNAAGNVCVARRDLSTNAWTGVSTSLTSNSLYDDHDVISFGIDGNGYMQMSWGMHNNALNYAISNTSVLGTSFNVTFTATSVASVTSSSITYPEFYNLADGDLYFFYRDGASGSGNTYYTRYDSAAKSWGTSSTKLVNGLTGNYSDGYASGNNRNAYTNTMVIDSQGRLQVSWTWRETSDWQTNHDIMYAYSADDTLKSWKQMSGATQTTPITLSNAGTVVSLDSKSSLMNQCSMTVDQNDNPLIATYWASGSDGTTRQYMLVWYDSTTKTWKQSQISNRPAESLVGNDSSQIRQVGRPQVLVDADGRVIVITRSGDKNNFITAYYSSDRTTWNSMSLYQVDTGRYEPNYDATRWASNGILSLYYEGAYSDSNGNRTAGAQQAYVLEWNSLRNMREIITCSFTGTAGDWGNKSNWSNVAAKTADGVWTTVQFGSTSSASSVVDLGASARTVGKMYFSGVTSTTITSTAGYSITMNNSGSVSTISVTGTHKINPTVILANNLSLSGAGEANFAGGISGNNFAITIYGSGVYKAKNVLAASLNSSYCGAFTAETLSVGALSLGYFYKLSAETANLASVSTLDQAVINVDAFNVSGAVTLGTSASLNSTTASAGSVIANSYATIAADILTVAGDMTLGDGASATAKTMNVSGTITVCGSEGVLTVDCLVADALVLGGEMPATASAALASASASSTEAVPEPTTIAVLAVAIPIGFALVKRRRKI